MNSLRYVVRAKFTRQPLPHNGMNGNILYLGKRGQWCTVGKALRFRTLKAAETALQEKWTRLHSAGVKGVILAVITLKPVQRST